MIHHCQPHQSIISWLISHTIADLFFWLVVATILVGALLVRRNSLMAKSIEQSVAQIDEAALINPDSTYLDFAVSSGDMIVPPPHFNPIIPDLDKVSEPQRMDFDDV